MPPELRRARPQALCRGRGEGAAQPVRSTVREASGRHRPTDGVRSSSDSERPRLAAHLVHGDSLHEEAVRSAAEQRRRRHGGAG